MDEAPQKKKREYKEMEEKHAGDLHAKVDMNTVSRGGQLSCVSGWLDKGHVC